MTGPPSSAASRRAWSGRVVEAGVVSLLVFTPLAYGTVEAWSEAIAELVILGMVTAWVLGMLGDWEIRVDLPPGWLPGVLFLALVFLQAVPLPRAVLHAAAPWSVRLHDLARAYLPGSEAAWATISLAPDATWREALKLAATAAFFLVVYNTYRTRAQVQRAIWAMIMTGAGIAVFGLVQRMTWNGRLYWVGPEAPHRQAFGPHAFGPFVNRAHFAALATVVIALALAILMAGVRPGSRGRRVWTARWRGLLETSSGVILIAVTLLGGAVLIAGSRGGIVGLVGMFITLAVLAAFEKPGQRPLNLVAVVAGVTLLAGAWLGFEIVAHTAGRLATETATLDESMRVLRWIDTGRLIQEAPIVGTGLASFEVAFPVFRTVAYPARFTHAESDWVQLVSDTGVVGALLVVLAIGQLLAFGFGAWRASAQRADRALRLCALAALVGLIIQAALNYGLPVMSLQLYAALVASVLVAATPRAATS
jgi:O-antigen ligase